MFLTKAKFATAIFLTMSLLASSAGVIAHQALAGKLREPYSTSTNQPVKNSRYLSDTRGSTKPEATATKEDAPHALAFSGRVVDPDGKPVKDARVYLLDYSPRKRSVLERARTDADGRYRFLARKSEFDTTYSAEPWNQTSVVAFAEGYGLGVLRDSFDELPARVDVTIQLAKDDVPITGRVIDLQGRPVAGVQIRVRGIQMPRDGDMIPFIDNLKANREGVPPQVEMLTGFRDNIGGWNLDGIFPPVTTDAAGRFYIKGIGRERMADLLIQGPTIEAKYVYAITRPCERIEVPAHKNVAYMNPIQPLYTHYDQLRAGLDHSSAVLGRCLVADITPPSQAAAQREAAVRLANVMARLPEDYRTVLVLRVFEGLSTEEVAQRMNRSGGAVRMLQLRALTALRAEMKSEE